LYQSHGLSLFLFGIAVHEHLSSAQLTAASTYCHTRSIWSSPGLNLQERTPSAMVGTASNSGGNPYIHFRQQEVQKVPSGTEIWVNSTLTCSSTSLNLKETSTSDTTLGEALRQPWVIGAIIIGKPSTSTNLAIQPNLHGGGLYTMHQHTMQTHASMLFLQPCGP
jgi:hypothetical protein